MVILFEVYYNNFSFEFALIMNALSYIVLQQIIFPIIKQKSHFDYSPTHPPSIVAIEIYARASKKKILFE